MHLTYQTAFVDDAGTLQIRDDIYGRDARHIAIFRSDERKVADIATPGRPTGTGISQDALRYQTREASPFADWFSSRQPHRSRSIAAGTAWSRAATQRSGRRELLRPPVPLGFRQADKKPLILGI